MLIIIYILYAHGWKNLCSVLELHLKAVGLVHSGNCLSTSHAYTSAQKSYLTFCETHNLQVLPADEQVILLYIAYLSPRVVGSSLNVYLAAIHHLNVLYGYNYLSLPSPRFKLAIKGITDNCPPHKSYPSPLTCWFH